MLGAFFWAAMWDWPAYYCALIFALHWLAVVAKRFLAGGKQWAPVMRDVLLLSGFSALVIGLFVGHFILVTSVGAWFCAE